MLTKLRLKSYKPPGRKWDFLHFKKLGRVLWQLVVVFALELHIDQPPESKVSEEQQMTTRSNSSVLEQCQLHSQAATGCVSKAHSGGTWDEVMGSLLRDDGSRIYSGKCVAVLRS